MECPFTEEQLEWLSENLKLECKHHSEFYSENGYIRIVLKLDGVEISESYFDL